VIFTIRFSAKIWLTQMLDKWLKDWLHGWQSLVVLDLFGMLIVCNNLLRSVREKVNTCCAFVRNN
jgi:hypothetical protein